MSFLKAMFGNYSKRELKRIQPIVDKVLGLEGKYLNMTDEELSSQTIALKERTDVRYIADVKPDNAEAMKSEFADRVFFTPKKMGAQTAEANINAGILVT